MKVKYTDVVETSPNKETTYFHKPNFLDDAGKVFTKDAEHLYYNTNPQNGLPLKYHIQDIAALALDQDLATIIPNEKAKQIIKFIYRNLEPSRVYIGQLWLGKGVGFSGLSIYCDNNIVAFENDGSIIRVPIDRSWKRKIGFLSLIKSGPLRKENYRYLVEKVSKPYVNTAKSIIASDERYLQTQRNTFKRNIADHAKGYLLYKNFKKAVNGLVVPEEVQKVLKIGEKKLIEEARECEKYFDAYRIAVKKHKEVVQAGECLTKALENPVNDFKQVMKMLKSKVIEDIGYQQKEGIWWVYSPMDYTYIDSYRTTYHLFLGRVKVWIKENGSFLFDFISYEDSHDVGTLHVANKGGYCFGSYENLIYTTAAKQEVAGLIVLIRSFLQSANYGSRYHKPNLIHMSIKAPKVIDNSFEVWSRGREK